MIGLALPMLHDVENPHEDVDPVDFGPYSILTWFRDMFFTLWRTYEVRNYTPIKM